MIDPKIIEELKAKHGSVALITATDPKTDDRFELLVKKPGKEQWRKFRAFAADPTKRANCLEALLRDCVLFPSMQEVEAILADKPALAEVFGDQVTGLAGASMEAETQVF